MTSAMLDELLEAKVSEEIAGVEDSETVTGDGG